MIIKRKQKGETEVIVPNWVLALVLVTAILMATVLLIKYFPVIVLWIR